MTWKSLAAGSLRLPRRPEQAAAGDMRERDTQPASGMSGGASQIALCRAAVSVRIAKKAALA